MIENKIIDILTERPNTFTVGKSRFYIYPITLGQSLLLSEILSELGINKENMNFNSSIEILRLVKCHRVAICRIIAIRTCKSKEEVFSVELINTRVNTINRGLKNEELASLFVACISDDSETINEIIKHFGIETEQKWFDRAVKAHTEKNSYTFFGKSIYGTLFGHLCEKYGWTMDYVLWGISHANIQLLMTDEIRTVYLSDDERKKAHIPHDRQVIKVDDAKNIDKIKKALNL